MINFRDRSDEEVEIHKIHVPRKDGTGTMVIEVYVLNSVVRVRDSYKDVILSTLKDSHPKLFKAVVRELWGEGMTTQDILTRIAKLAALKAQLAAAIKEYNDAK